MGKNATNLAAHIRDKTLELLLEKDPEAVTTRDIAKACGVTATSIYYYYQDRDALFTEVKLYCIEKMDQAIARNVSSHVSACVTAGGRPNETDPLAEARAGMEAFRDWAFANPRMALLVMERLKADTESGPEKMEKYYRSTMFAKDIMEKLARAGLSVSGNAARDACLWIAALWGVVESVLLNRTLPQYWTPQGGLELTNHMIDLLLASLRENICISC